MKRIITNRSKRSLDTKPNHWANDEGTAFKNPWPSAAPSTWSETIRKPLPLAQYSQSFTAQAKANERKIVKPDWGDSSLEKQGLSRSDSVVIGTWLGHASSLLELPCFDAGADEGKGTHNNSVWLLFDPIFSQRAGPTQYTGPSRLFRPPCAVDDLPGCDAVFISHNHYDHLDLTTIETILKKFPKALFFVPLRNKQWMVESGVPADSVFELDWWDKLELVRNQMATGVRPWKQIKEDESPPGSSLQITCVPAQHNSGRGVTDQGSTLWSGWVVERFLNSAGQKRRRSAVYHAGDTGYRRDTKSTEVCPAFKEIGTMGPFDLAFIPIWRGGTLGFVSYLGLKLSLQDLSSTAHGTPADATCMHLDVKSRNTIAIHWGTFVGSETEAYEAMVDFKKACDKAGISALSKGYPSEQGSAGTLDYGGSLAVRIE